MSAAAAENRVSQVLAHLTAAAAPTEPVQIVSRTNGVAVIQINNPPVNSLGSKVQEGLARCYEEAVNDSSIKAVVITGTKSVFMAGADIDALGKLQRTPGVTKAQTYKFVEAGNKIFNRLETGPKPIVAAVTGNALGGGCELAMICAARVATPTAAFGLPELSLGIIPGLGGTQRLPRLIGVEKAVSATLSGKPLKAAEAQKLGLVDAVVKPDQLLLTAGKLALDIAAGKVPRRITSQLNDKIGTMEAGGRAVIEMARAQALKKNRNLPQPFGYLEAVQEGIEKGFEAGLKKEQEVFSGLVLHPVSKSLIHFFFAQRATTKGLPTKASGKPIQTVAVLGGGTMGAGICIVYLLAGYNVILKEINDALVLAGVERIVNDLTRVAKARKLPIMMVEVLMRQLTTTTGFDGFDKVDLVVEAVLENLKLKQEIFAELERRCPKHAILATNTSTIDIDEIAKNTTAQDRVIGLHFFSPAHVMPLLEIIRTKSTSENTIAACLQMSKRIKKTPVVVGNCVGFTANRAFFPYGQSAGLLVDAGADPYKIDKALEKFGMPMGVFRMADLSGIDVFKHVSGTINAAYGSRCYNGTLGHRLFDAKRLGQKTGKGYYAYVKGKPVPDASLKPIIEAARAEATNRASVDASKLSDEELVEATLFPVVNEALRILEEGYARNEADVDVITAMGYGYPAWRGGVLHWAANHPKGGYKYIRDRLAQMSQQWGGPNNKVVQEFFKPCQLLEKKANEQKKQ
jgi:enoyl-CoA hydratase/3-hydroxyacyl-CoA dehydrogenase